jgi:hypothetical protein
VGVVQTAAGAEAEQWALTTKEQHARKGRSVRRRENPVKREAVGHTKMKRLCRRLSIPTWQAVGLLESLWHLTARETPRGDIGKLPDETIALAIDYRGNEAEMLEALVASGWLDPDPVCRLVVHDWADHADDAVQMRLARNRQFFASGRAPKLTRLTGQERQAAQEFYVTAGTLRQASCAQIPDLCAREEGNETSATEPCAQPQQSCAQNAQLGALPEPKPLPEPEPGPEPGPFDDSPDSRKHRANSGEFTKECPQPQAQTPNQGRKHTPEDRRRFAITITRMTGRAQTDVDLDGVLAALCDHPVEGFCNYLQRLPAKFQLGGRNAPRKPGCGWFISTARTYVRTEVTQSPTENRCRHGKTIGSCCNDPASHEAMTNSF